MLWYKSWLETRWQFAIGLVVLGLSAGGAVLAYPQLIKLMPMADGVDTTGVLGRRVREGLELARTYRGYIWSNSFNQNLTQMATLFAAVLGSGGPFMHGSALYTLSLPVTRRRLLAVRAATGLAELGAILFAAALVIPALSPAVGERYSVTSALVHALCLFAAAGAFFSLAVLLSTSFGDIWRPLLLTCGVAVVLAVLDETVVSLGRFSIYAIMSGESYFHDGRLPWLGLGISAAIAFTLLFGASLNLARRDF